MRVLQLAPVWETVPPPAYGGTETVVSGLTEELHRRGVEVVLAASGDSSSSAPVWSWCARSLRPAGLIDHPLPYALMHVVHALKEAREFDIIHNHNGPPSELGMALSHLTDVPMLTTLHNNLVDETRPIWSSYRGWYNTISWSQYRASPPLPNACFAGVVHNGIDVESFPFSCQKAGYALFVGRIAPEKAPHLAIEAALRAGTRIVIAGKISAPEERDYFEALVRPRLDAPGVEFVGEADASLKRELYAGAACLLAPIQWEEPFGLVMVEAMACGTPVIAMTRGAAPELVIDGTTGFLVKDVPQMAAAIEMARALDPAACREHVERNFGLAALADRYLAVYGRMLLDGAEVEGTQ